MPLVSFRRGSEKPSRRRSRSHRARLTGDRNPGVTKKSPTAPTVRVGQLAAIAYAKLMAFDALMLSRLQFAFTIAFHIIFPSFTIGLASFLAVLEAVWLFTKREAFKTLYLFWAKVFAISFGMGVVSGVVMSYEFGTNWSVFAKASAPVLGPLLAFEVLTAFFLEASFLGVLRHAGLGLLDHLGQ